MKLTRTDKRWIKEFCRQLTERFPGMVDQLLNYGSKARGEAGPDSDLDVLLIVRNEMSGRKRQMREIGYLLAAEGDVFHPSWLTQCKNGRISNAAVRGCVRLSSATRCACYEEVDRQ